MVHRGLTRQTLMSWTDAQPRVWGLEAAGGMTWKLIGTLLVLYLRMQSPGTP
jgi:fumarate reductase subunit D